MFCNNLILIIEQNKIGWIAKVGIWATNLISIPLVIEKYVCFIVTWLAVKTG